MGGGGGMKGMKMKSVQTQTADGKVMHMMMMVPEAEGDEAAVEASGDVSEGEVVGGGGAKQSGADIAGVRSLQDMLQGALKQ